MAAPRTDPLDRLAVHGWALLDVAGWDGTGFRHFEPGPILLAHFRRDAIAALGAALAADADLLGRLLELFPRTAGVVRPGRELVALVRLLDRMAERQAHPSIDDPSDEALAGFLLPEAVADAVELLLHAEATATAGRLACATLVNLLAEDPDLHRTIAADADGQRRLDAVLRIGADLAADRAIPEALVADATRWVVSLLRARNRPPR